MTELSPPVRTRTRVAAYALCIRSGRVLLCRIAPGPWGDPGKWTLPGGGLAFGEAPATAALRELEEETGLRGAVRSLAAVRDESARWVHPDDGVDEAIHSVQVMYRVDVTAGELRAEVDGSTDSAAWFTRDEALALPLVDLAQAGVRLAFEEG